MSSAARRDAYHVANINLKIIHMKKLTRILFISLFLITSISSCKLTLVGRYDSIMDNTVTDLQQNVSRFFVKADAEVGTPAFDYNNYKKFYEDIKVQLATLRIRSAAVSEGSIADKEVGLLDENIKNLEKLHKLGIGTIDEVALLRSAFDNQFMAITKLQMALKARNEKR
jgi:hypothetical protein